MKLQDLIDQLEEMKKQTLWENKDVQVLVTVHTKDGTGCIGASIIDHVGTDGFACVMLQTEEKLTPVGTTNVERL